MSAVLAPPFDGLSVVVLWACGARLIKGLRKGERHLELGWAGSCKGCGCMGSESWAARAIAATAVAVRASGGWRADRSATELPVLPECSWGEACALGADLILRHHPEGRERGREGGREGGGGGEREHSCPLGRGGPRQETKGRKRIVYKIRRVEWAEGRKRRASGGGAPAGGGASGSLSNKSR
eukprot:scaffold30339_cov32-Tisochrysis_lutea.AAC.7